MKENKLFKISIAEIAIGVIIQILAVIGIGDESGILSGVGS